MLFYAIFKFVDMFEVHFDISRWIVNKLVTICHNLFESGSFFNSICKKYFRKWEKLHDKVGIRLQTPLNKPWFCISVQPRSLIISWLQLISKSNELEIANKYVRQHCFYLSTEGAYKTLLGSHYKKHLQTTVVRQEEFD